MTPLSTSDFREALADVARNQTFIKLGSAGDNIFLHEDDWELISFLLNAFDHRGKGEARGTEEFDILDSDLRAEALLQPLP